MSREGTPGPVPWATIAIPTYNRAGSFLPNALASACEQSEPDLEILVSDNASTDATPELVRAFRDPRIRYHRHASNIGSSHNMNFCVQEARGEYFLLLPDDDLIDPDFLRSCATLAAENLRAGIIRTGTRIIDGEGTLLREAPNGAIGPSFPDLVRAWIDRRISPYQCSTLYKTALLKRIGFESRHYLFDDVLSFFKIAAESGWVGLPTTKASFRLHHGELTSKTPIAQWCEESLDLLELLCELNPADARYIRDHGLKFLAEGNYRRALRRPFPDRLSACVTVLRTHRFALPPRQIVTEQLPRLLRQLASTSRRSP
jgi:glycosyltransferase involved in cell wall biosynthesis